jgi:predicted transcriptional regulator
MSERPPGRPRVPLLEHPLTRRMLQTDLAHSGKSQSELAEKYGVTQPSISEFAARHAATIQQIRDDAANEFAGLAIAQKAARLEVYRELLDACMTPVPKTAGKDGDWVRDEDGNVVHEIDAAVAGKLLRNVAEELGHLPNRVTLGGEVGVTTSYTVNGVDPGALK